MSTLARRQSFRRAMLGHRALLCLIAGVVIDAAPAGGPLHPSRSHAHAEPHSHAHAAHLTHHTTLPGAHLPAAAWPEDCPPEMHEAARLLDFGSFVPEGFVRRVLRLVAYVHI